jgi:hypothetical protein
MVFRQVALAVSVYLDMCTQFLDVYKVEKARNFRFFSHNHFYHLTL